MKKHMHTKVVGISFQKGINELIESNKVKVGDVILLYPEKDNKYDSNAIMVYTIKNIKLGYLSRKTAKNISKRLASGKEYLVTIANITGDGNKKSYGINIRIEDK